MEGLSTIQKLVVFALPILFAITVHEAAHGWSASRLGDTTAKMLGRDMVIEYRFANNQLYQAVFRLGEEYIIENN